MSAILSIYNKKAYREYVLIPPQSIADYSVVVGSDEFWLENDLELSLEMLEESINLNPDDQYSLYRITGEERILEKEPVALMDSSFFEIITRDNENLSLFVRMQERLFVPEKCFRLSSEKSGFSIGSSMDCDICYSFRNEVKPEHVVISKIGSQFQVTVNADEGVYVNGNAVRKNSVLNYGDKLNVFELCLVYLGGKDNDLFSTNPDMAKVMFSHDAICEYDSGGDKENYSLPQATGEKLFFRAPRQMEPIETETVSFEDPPSLNKVEEMTLFQMVGNSLLMIFPMLAGCFVMIIASRYNGNASSFFMYTGLVMAVASGITSIVLALSNSRRQKKRIKEEEKNRFEAYGRYLQIKRDKIAKMYESNLESLLKMYPDAQECTSINITDQRLWNRNVDQSDFLQVRLGTGDIPFQGKIEIPAEKFHVEADALRDKPQFIKQNFETLFDAPILVDMYAHRLIGLVGGEDRFGAFEIARLMIIQLASTHCYTDVKMVFLFDETVSMDTAEWDFVRWLPHVWSDDRKIRYVAASHNEINDVCYELSKIFRERFEKSSDVTIVREKVIPHFILFVSNPSLIDGELIGNYIFKNPEQVGLTTVFLSELYQDQPNACTYFIQNDFRFCGIKDINSTDIPIKLDRVTIAEADEYARNIASVRVKEAGQTGEIPDQLSFLEMYGVNTCEELDAPDRWRKNRIYENIRGFLGFDGPDSLCVLDLHEKYHGPHGLVAGTTGSGKSETLQTYLLSLAVNYSPEDVSFFIIDYKGGGMANLFNGLPHLAGQISNLSGSQIARALVSIKAENRRRQRLFNLAGVNNINKYTKLFKNGELIEPIPHLLIVIDEFAELKREEPEFMRELISVAQVGRSLGVHLILSTQKPSGTVDDNIWSNSKFRLCLRVQTKEDSTEMLGRPDAAYITRAGRGYLQVGNDEIYEMFQSGYSAATYAPGLSNGNEATGLVTRTGQIELKFVSQKDVSEDKSELTQLDAVIAYLRSVAQEMGYRKTSELWMPILRNPLFLQDFDEYKEKCFDFDKKSYRVNPDSLRENWDLSCVVGQSDDPQNQQQMPFVLSLAKGGHHAVVGSVVSGKSAFLTTAIYSLATTYDPSLFWFYAIDYSSHMLSCLEELPHCGGILYENEEEKLDRLINLLDNMLEDRKKKFRGGNYSNYFRVHGAEYPAVVLVIDNFSSFNEKTNEKYVSWIIKLSKQGASNGMYLFVSGGAYNSSEIPGRLAENIGTGIAINLPDKFAYGDVLRTMRLDILPESGLKGRGLAYVDDRILEIQTALTMDAEDDYRRLDAVSDKCRIIADAFQSLRAASVPEIPEKPEWEVFSKHPDVISAAATDNFVPIGYRSDNALVQSLDMFRNYCFLINGGNHSGKKSFMRLMILSVLMKQDSQVVIIDNGNTFNDLADSDRVRIVNDQDALYEWCFNDLTPMFKERNEKKKHLLDEGYEDAEYYEQMAEFTSVFVFIASIPWFIKTVYDDEHQMNGFMNTIFKKGQGHKISFIGCLDTGNRNELGGYDVFNSFTAYRYGIQLGGEAINNPWLGFDYLKASEQVVSYPPGTGQLSQASGGSGFKVVVPLAKKNRKK